MTVSGNGGALAINESVTAEIGHVWRVGAVVVVDGRRSVTRLPHYRDELTHSATPV